MPRPAKPFRAEPYAYHQELQLRVEDLTNLGHGVARQDGWVILVPFALPGETVRARVYRNHRNFSEADLLEVLERSPDRVEATCALFGTCGGCQYQNLAYERQLDWKRRQVRELLRRLAGLPDVEVDPVVPSPLRFGYRSKLTPHFQVPQRDRGGEPDLGPIGFLRCGHRFQLVDVPACPIASGPINEALTRLRADVRARSASFRKGATLLLRESADGTVLTRSEELCEQRVGSLVFRFPAGSFFQTNPSILPAFVDHVRDEAVASGARNLVDTYCGSGLFALCAASAFDHVEGIEVNEESLAWARENARHNGIANATFHLGSAEAIFGGLPFPGHDSAVVIDPPRKGCSGEFLDQLFAFGPRAVVYVSCDPATQMRDLARFREAGYRVTRVRPFDLFPQTRHLECVVSLRRAPDHSNVTVPT
jgi:23S rRNA (uracil1939-C5)-methyltransferase/tRNA (uracil-5-)-methyltransferase